MPLSKEFVEQLTRIAGQEKSDKIRRYLTDAEIQLIIDAYCAAHRE